MKKLNDYSQAFMKTFFWEWKYIFRDKAVFSSFILVAVLVSFLYTYLYSRETLQELPIGIVDEDNTASSRQFLRMLDATSQVVITGSYANLQEAEQEFKKQHVRGIVIVPKDFNKDLQRGEQPVVSVFTDASYLLYYKQVLTATKMSATYMNVGVQLKKTASQGKLPSQAKDDTLAVGGKVVSLYNPSLGYATFLIPAVLVIIFQTTILTAIGILGGTMREERKFHKLYANSEGFIGSLFIVMGKATAYLIIGLIILLMMLGIVMPIFGIPMRGNFLSVVAYMIPFLLAVVFLGVSLVNFFKRREDAILLVMYTSIPSILLIGIAWPPQAMPQWLEKLSYLIPTTLGAKGFVSLTQMGATLPTIQNFWFEMWALCILYLVLAVFSIRKMINE